MLVTERKQEQSKMQWYAKDNKDPFDDYPVADGWEWVRWYYLSTRTHPITGVSYENKVWVGYHLPKRH